MLQDKQFNFMGFHTSSLQQRKSLIPKSIQFGNSSTVKSSKAIRVRLSSPLAQLHKTPFGGGEFGSPSWGPLQQFPTIWINAGFCCCWQLFNAPSSSSPDPKPSLDDADVVVVEILFARIVSARASEDTVIFIDGLIFRSSMWNLTDLWRRSDSPVEPILQLFSFHKIKNHTCQFTQCLTLWLDWIAFPNLFTISF